MTAESFWWGFGLASIVFVSGLVVRAVYSGINAILNDPKE